MRSECSWAGTATCGRASRLLIPSSEDLSSRLASFHSALPGFLESLLSPSAVYTTRGPPDNTERPQRLSSGDFAVCVGNLTGWFAYSTISVGKAALPLHLSRATRMFPPWLAGVETSQGHFLLCSAALLTDWPRRNCHIFTMDIRHCSKLLQQYPTPFSTNTIGDCCVFELHVYTYNQCIFSHITQP